MKRYQLLFAFFFIFLNRSYSQTNDTVFSRKWNLSAEANMYLIPDNFIFLPVLRADKNHLHLEARYNYEDLNTFSAWAGYNFSGGKKLEYLITPMLGGVIGSSNGLATGLELNFVYKKLELWSESEHFFSVNDVVYNFLYNWTDLSYSPRDWFWFGVSGQRTKVVETGLDFNRGLFIGASYKSLEFTTYLYNIGFSEKYVLLTITFNH